MEMFLLMSNNLLVKRIDFSTLTVSDSDTAHTYQHRNVKKSRSAKVDKKQKETHIIY